MEQKAGLDDPFNELIKLIKTLRGENGCPWDKKQTPQSMEAYLIEEVYELLDAIESDNKNHIMEELGDALFHLFFIARLYEEQGFFNINDSVRAIHKKMIRRHPHVFGNTQLSSAEEVLNNWEKIKKDEKKDSNEKKSFLENVPKKLPSLMRAYRLTDRASRVGFDWDNINGVISKVEEEWLELKKAIDSKNTDHIIDELGDVIFSVVNLSRFVKINPETALISSLKKFTSRFKYIEENLEKQGKSLDSANLEEMDSLWNEAKNIGI